MRFAMMLVAVAVIAFPARASAQERAVGKVPPYYYYILENCPGRNLEVTLERGRKLSGRCHARLADRFQLTRRGVTYDVPYTSIARIKVRRSFFEKLKATALAPYVQVKTAIGMAQFYDDFL